MVGELDGPKFGPSCEALTVVLYLRVDVVVNVVAGTVEFVVVAVVVVEIVVATAGGRSVYEWSVVAVEFAKFVIALSGHELQFQMHWSRLERSRSTMGCCSRLVK